MVKEAVERGLSSPRGASPTSPKRYRLSRKAILAEVEGALRRPRADYIDFYQIHRWGGETLIEETLEALNDVVRAGKARYIGA